MGIIASIAVAQVLMGPGMAGQQANLASLIPAAEVIVVAEITDTNDSRTPSDGPLMARARVAGCCQRKIAKESIVRIHGNGVGWTQLSKRRSTDSLLGVCRAELLANSLEPLRQGELLHRARRHTGSQRQLVEEGSGDTSGTSVWQRRPDAGHVEVAHLDPCVFESDGSPSPW